MARIAFLLLIELERVLSCQESGEAVDGAKAEAHDWLGSSKKSDHEIKKGGGSSNHERAAAVQKEASAPRNQKAERG